MKPGGSCSQLCRLRSVSFSPVQEPGRDCATKRIRSVSGDWRTHSIVGSTAVGSSPTSGVWVMESSPSSQRLLPGSRVMVYCHVADPCGTRTSGGGRLRSAEGGRAVQRRPSKWPKLGPRQYMSLGAGASPWNSTRITTSLDSASFEKSPGAIESDRPVVLASCWFWLPHSGPLGRGNSTNRMMASGRACSSSTTA